MKFTEKPFEKKAQSDCLVIPLIKFKDKILWPHEGKLKLLYESPIVTGDFKGNEGETTLLYGNKEDPRVLLLGLGDREGLTVEKLRRSFSAVAKLAFRYKIKSLTLIVPEIEKMPSQDIFRGVFEGLLLSNYTFEQLK